MKYGYLHPPHWRIYCDQHAELDIRQKVDSYPNKLYEKAIKFARQINKIADQFKVKPPQPDPLLKKISTKSLNTRRSNKKSPSTGRFTILLYKHPNEEYEVTDVIIPPPPPLSLKNSRKKTKPKARREQLRKRRPIVPNGMKVITKITNTT